MAESLLQRPEMSHRTRSARVVSTALVAFLLTSRAAFAQDTSGTGSLIGAIRDEAGAQVAFATICLSGTTICAVANEQGAFRLPNVRAGTYGIETTAPGGTALPLGPVDVRAGVEQRLDVTLPSPEPLETTVTVTASGAALPAEVKTSGYLVTSREIAKDAGALQDVSRYIQTLPGVVVPPGSSDF